MRGERLTKAEDKLFEEALTIFGEEKDPDLLQRLIILDNPPTKLSDGKKEGENDSLNVKSKVVNSEKSKAPQVHCYSQVLHQLVLLLIPENKCNFHNYILSKFRISQCEMRLLLVYVILSLFISVS